jgi:sigma-B regulation protein RsbU (phosphoserine phosphatase)
MQCERAPTHDFPAQDAQVRAAARGTLESSIRWLSRSLHIEPVSLLVHSGDRYELACATAMDRSREYALLERGSVIQRLKAHEEPVPVAWVHGKCHVGGELVEGREAVVLGALGARFLVGLPASGQLSGLLSLGSKVGDEPVSPADLRLLQSIAPEVAFALESCRLRVALAAESTERQKLEWELGVAREVQERLFPLGFPFTPGLDHYCIWRAARGVSGDYLDYIELPDGNLGVAIGDVSGKGLSAALLMSSLHSMVRALSLAHRLSLGDLVATINKMFFRVSPDNCYTTLFLARFDPHEGRLHYVNAGHEPPCVLRRSGSGRRVIPLEPSGPVIGILRASPYREEVITLQPDDVLVAYTDGVAEVRNTAGEEWGNRRLLETVQANCERNARDIVSQVMSEADAFAVGAPQFDDMTLWVARVASAEADSLIEIVEPVAMRAATCAA